MADEVNINDHGDAEFTITCKNCGSTDCEVRNDSGCGSSGTGMYGSIDIVCKSCGAYKTIVDY